MAAPSFMENPERLLERHLARGPWRVEEFPHAQPGGLVTLSSGAGRIADVIDPATARALAALPDLLEACKAALSEKPWGELQPMLRAAVAKVDEVPRLAIELWCRGMDGAANWVAGVGAGVHFEQPCHYEADVEFLRGLGIVEGVRETKDEKGRQAWVVTLKRPADLVR